MSPSIFSSLEKQFKYLHILQNIYTDTDISVISQNGPMISANWYFSQVLIKKREGKTCNRSLHLELNRRRCSYVAAQWLFSYRGAPVGNIWTFRIFGIENLLVSAFQISVFVALLSFYIFANSVFFRFWNVDFKTSDLISIFTIIWYFVLSMILRGWTSVSTLIWKCFMCVNSLSTSRTSLACDSEGLFDFPSPVNNLLSKLTKVISYYLYL